LLNLNRACQTCHRIPEDELRERVERIQRTTHEIRDRAMDAVVALIGDITAARESAPPDAIAQARSFHRRAQFLLDFIEAENSTGFHAPQEAARILAQSIDLARQGQLALRGAPDDTQPPTVPE
jgi:nitrite reductase (cytochrome c-552)